MQDKSPSLTEVTWSDIRLRVKTTAPDIFEAIEKMNPDKSYRLYLARYPFGSMIVGNNGILNIPQNDTLIPINDPLLPNKLREDLGYNSLAMALALILNNTVQLFTEEQKNEIETDGVYSTGIVLAARRVLDPTLSYHAARFFRMTAGLRTAAFLPSISEQSSFERLKRHCGLTTGKPETQSDQWHLLAELANHKNFPEGWFTELLMFSAKWLKPRNDDAWKLFRQALMERAWKFSAYPRNIIQVNRIWTKFITSINNKKTTGFVLNTVRHIIEASLGQAVSYVPCDSGNNGGPFDAFTKIILDTYGLKKSAPIFMVPTYFDLDSPTTNYISIQTPGSQWASARSTTVSNLINDTREIKYILHQFINLIRDNVINVSDTPFSRLTGIDYTFYHADKDKYGELLCSANALDGHPIMEKWRKHPTNNELAYRNTFMRSCVKIEAKTKR